MTADVQPAAFNLVGNPSASFASSTDGNASPPLAGGIYSVWCTGNNNAYIGVANQISTALSTTTGYPLVVNTVPIQIYVPPNYAISAVSSSSAPTVGYAQVV